MATTHNSLKILSKSILSRLENRKYIIFNPSKRGDLQTELYQMLSRNIVTDEDIVNEVRTQVTTHSEQLNDHNITETAAFQSRKRQVREQLGDNELHGFYFRGTLRDACIKVGKFLFDTSLVEDVFESDEAIHKLVMETIQNFDEKKVV